jgi:hypothetical protein
LEQFQYSVPFLLNVCFTIQRSAPLMHTGYYIYHLL